MKKIFLKIMPVMLSAIIIAASCSDFLDEKPKGQVTTQNFYKTEADAIAAANAIYFYLVAGYSPNGLWDENYGGLFFNDFWDLPELMSDNVVSKMTVADYTSVASFNINADNVRVHCLWRDFFQTINACNTVIIKVPNTTITDEVKRNQLIAEARFVRAVCYFELTRFFGDVPLHTEPTESIEDANIARTPVDQIYPVILEDLKYAEENLKFTERLGKGRPFALSATAMLSRVYLTIGVKQKNNEYLRLAASMADKVIPSFPMSNFEDLFKLENRFKGERIWEINFSATLSEGWYGNQFLVRLLPKMDTNKGGPNNAQGYDAATEDLYLAYEPGDLRRDVTLFRNFTYNDGTVEVFDAPYFCKYWDRVAEPKGNESNATYPYLRTAEMYLIKAEALNEANQGPTQEAKDAINEVRKRAGLGNTTATTYTDFKRAILNERRCEFAIEGHRWHDLVRMCTLDELKQRVGTAKTGVTPLAKHFLFPIPDRERGASGGLLTQNEGY
ncbi:MAG: RagB/SusD family nutrient uptake outer membrane protein [Prevotellaceae bacterium]|jgi:hypothetical protein|nr:RagB/SusD family nutrient uptake outer membrane protein [Prevotellaceae bacterium]